jgi:hypothetical protein
MNWKDDSQRKGAVMTETEIQELTKRVERIERALVVQGILERPKPKPVVVERPKVVARNIQELLAVEGVPRTVVGTYDSTARRFRESHPGSPLVFLPSAECTWM